MPLDVLALLVTFALAGALLGAIAVPERIGVVERIFLSIALSVPATILAAAPGLLVHRFGAVALLLGLAALAAAVIARVRPSGGRIRDRAAELRGWRPTWLQAVATAAAVAATWFAVVGPQVDAYHGQPRSTIVYYHWGVAQRVLDDGKVPATLPEWGQPRPFPVEYLFSAVHGASAGALAGGAGFDLAERYRLAVIAFALLALLALARRWLPAWWAWLAAVLVLSLAHLQERLLNYKPEVLAVSLVLWSGWMVDEAIERRSLRWGGMAGALVACAYLAHPVGSILAGPLWLGILAGRALSHLLRRSGGARAGIAALAPAARVVVVAAVLFAAVFAVTRGIAGSTGQDLLQSPRHGVDPTRVIYRLAYLGPAASGSVAAATRVAQAAGAPTTAECAHPFGRLPSIAPFTRLNLSARSTQALLAAAFAAFCVLALTLLPGRLEVPLITFAVYGFAVYAVGELVCGVYHTWAPERVGPLRLIPYWGVALAVPIATACWALADALSRWSRWQGFVARARRWRVVAAALPAAALTVAVLLVLTPMGGARIVTQPGEPLSPAVRDAYAWIDRNSPTDSVILANGYTEGVIASLGHRTGELDGRTPYLQPDPWRAHAIRELRGVRAFFLRPRRHPGALPKRAAYVLVGRRGVNLGGSAFPARWAAVRRLPYLRVAQAFADPGAPAGSDLVLYRVVRRPPVRHAAPG